MDILRFITAGSVDDGKSTLIGRLLYDTDNIKNDVLESLSSNNGLNLAYLTDGLRAERQQGITIDVAYKYFTTKNRKYIISDAPGHFQYIKNLVTGASNADVMVILVDALNGVTDQTKRHLLVASFLRIRNVIVVVNKMDLVGYNERVFNNIKTKFQSINITLDLPDIQFIPACALDGDNVTFDSDKMRWYHGTNLFSYLENLKPDTSRGYSGVRFSLQYPIQQKFFGKIVAGHIPIGDELILQDSDRKAVVKRITTGYLETSNASAGQNVCLFFDGAFELKRGQLLYTEENKPIVGFEFCADLCWLDSKEQLQISSLYILRIGAFETTCEITSVIYKKDNVTYELDDVRKDVSVNEFARVSIKTTDKVVYDKFVDVPETGRAILIDISTFNTSAALIIV